jgi:hypothetical protein
VRPFAVSRRPFWAAALLAAAVIGGGSVAASDGVRATYDVRFAGIRIATARIDASVADAIYTMNFTSSYSVLFYSGTITGRVVGRIAGERIQPKDYTLGSTGDPPRHSAMTFDGNAVRDVSIEPPLGADWNEGRILLQPQHRRGVLDPLSGLVYAALRAGNGEQDACRTTVPVFSGVSRFDVALSPAEPRPTRAAASSLSAPDVISCNIRFVPIAGHRPANQTVRALQASSTMRVDFERAITGNVRLPHRIEIPTRFGTVAIQRTG